MKLFCSRHRIGSSLLRCAIEITRSRRCRITDTETLSTLKHNPVITTRYQINIYMKGHVELKDHLLDWTIMVIDLLGFCWKCTKLGLSTIINSERFVCLFQKEKVWELHFYQASNLCPLELPNITRHLKGPSKLWILWVGIKNRVKMWVSWSKPPGKLPPNYCNFHTQASNNDNCKSWKYVTCHLLASNRYARRILGDHIFTEPIAKKVKHGIGNLFDNRQPCLQTQRSQIPFSPF